MRKATLVNSGEDTSRGWEESLGPAATARTARPGATAPSLRRHPQGETSEEVNNL